MINMAAHLIIYNNDDMLLGRNYAFLTRLCRNKVSNHLE